jgi:nitroimidazol reductase NimA-like FMN-containing flavoprotein (pyridoxamine 5'-phosphate oxidase superfamily)
MSDPQPYAPQDVIDDSRYMTLGTAGADGAPWVSPVWFAPAAYRAFYWASKPEARHSRNIAARPEVSIVFFDSRVLPDDVRAVYLSATAEQLDDDERERGVEVYAAQSVRQGLPAWTAADVRAPARHRLYRATVRECFVLGPRDDRVAVPLERL